MKTKTIHRLHSGVVAALLTGAAMTISATAFAQEKHMVPSIGVVDTDRIIQEALAAKGVRLEREKYAASYQGQIKEEETKLRAEETDLTNQRNVLAQDVYQQRVQAFQQEFAEYQAQVKDKQDRLDYSYQQAMQEIGNTIIVVSSDVAKTQGLNMVMARSQLMIFDPSMDVTAPVLDKLNQRLPSVKFQDPATLQRQAQTGAPGAAPAAPAAAPAAPPAKKK